MTVENYSSIIWIGKCNKYAIVDNEDCDKLMMKNWAISRGYANISNTRRRRRERSELGSMHRIVMNNPTGKVIDHINHNKLDNRKINLRICTPAQNIRNSLPSKQNKLGLKGVNWSPACSKWRARIVFNRKNIHLGLFSTIEDAAKAYDHAASQYFGEFAATNKQLGLIKYD